MRKFDELTSENSCLNKAEDDEPIFVLKSTDELASSIVRTWAIMYHKTKSAQPGGMSPKQREKFEEAMQLATAMDQWRAKWLSGQGTPDVKLEAALAAHAHAHAGAIRKRPLESQDVIVRLCALQAEVFQHLNNAESADCFCGEGGFWPRKGVNSETSTYDGTFANGYRNDGAALGFIEQAVKEKLESMTGHAIESVGAVWSEEQLVSAAEVRAELAEPPSGMSEREIADANNNPLCDRLETIHVTALEMQKRMMKISPYMKESLQKIIDLSGGFAKIPQEE